MSSLRLFAILGLLSVLPVANASAQNYAFELDESVAVASLADAKAKPRKLAEGADPAISPDGTQVAYTQSDDEGNRRIAVINIATGKSRLVQGIPGKNEFMPLWSADGQKLFFHHFMESDWGLASVNAAGEGFEIVVDKAKRQVAGFASLPSGNSWLCHDMEGFFALHPGEKGDWNIFGHRKTAALEGLSMPSRLSVAPDGKTALFAQFVDAETKQDDDGPPSAIFVFELETGKVTRATPKGWNADAPSWLPDGKAFLFSSFDRKTEKPSIYRLSVEPGAKPVLVQKNARNPSVASK